jgi:RNA polymerase sigma-70 factor (ECF subfamily)
MAGKSSLLTSEDIKNDELVRIVAQAKKGDDQALESLCRFVYRRIYTYIYYRVRHREDAEDLTTEVIVKMVKALEKQNGNFMAWIYKIAANTLIDQQRRQVSRRETSIDELKIDLPDKKGSMPKNLLTVDKLKLGISELTSEQAEVITLRFFQENNIEETAKTMGKSVGAVKVMQFRAIKALREFFKKKGYAI